MGTASSLIRSLKAQKQAKQIGESSGSHNKNSEEPVTHEVDQLATKVMDKCPPIDIPVFWAQGPHCLKKH